MKTLEKNDNPLYFLSGGGEMGERIRATDWSKTPLGDPLSWPSSLKTMVAVMLDNPFGMYIAWGKEYIQLYNDGYRPILGENKHPKALGISTRETFSEIWDIIGPMFEGVMNGKGVGFPDFMLPLNRNGYVEECYFDFSYSPIRLDDGNVGGVLVTVIETTNKKKAEDNLRESEQRFRSMADNIPNLAWMANADGYIYWYNKKWFEYTGTTPAEMEGWGWQSVHDPKELPVVLEKWKTSLATGKPFEMIFPLKGADGNFRQFLTRVLPIHNEKGEIYQWFGTNTDITKQQLAEQSLRESEMRFRAIADDAPVFIFLAGENAEVEYLNKTWREYTGFVEDYMGRAWAQITHPDDVDPATKIYMDGFNKRESCSFENRQKGTDGIYRTILWKATPRFSPNGEFIGMMGVGLDIHERKKMEEALKESEQKVRSLVESAPFPIGVYTGKEMRIELANQSIIDVWGKGKDVIGKLYSEILPELGNQEIFSQLDRVYATGVAFHAHNQRVDLIIGNKLQTFYFNYSFTPLFDSDNKVYGVMNTAADVTELVISKQRLEKSEQNLRNMIMQSPVAMCILLGPQHIIEVANDSMVTTWGKNREDVMSKPVFEALPEAKNQGLEELLSIVYTKGETFKANERPVDLQREGKIETTYQNFVYEPYLDENGTILGVLAVTIDVTAQVKARRMIEDVVKDRTKDLAEANERLQRSNAELAQFAYIASHDLQEPLRKISSFSQMLESSLEGNLSERSVSYLSKIKNASVRMNTLIRDVLSYSELTKEKDVFVKVDLNHIVQNICNDFDLLIEQKNAKITYDNLPVVKAIPTQMSQLFGNLISNSLKFTRKDTAPHIIIKVKELEEVEKTQNAKLESHKRYWNIEVSDNGIGFKPEFADNIFNIFQRLHGKSEFEGTGIGLAMCKKIAINHHGDINAYKSSDKGAIFTINLPIAE